MSTSSSFRRPRIPKPKLGFNVLARAYELFSFPFTGIGSTTKKLREKPDEVKRMIKAGIRANRYVRQNRDGAIQVMMEWGKTDREAAANTYDSTWRIFSEDGGMTENGLKSRHRPGEAVHEYRPSGGDLGCGGF